MGKILKNIGSIVQISPVEGASCKFKGPCTECMLYLNKNSPQLKSWLFSAMVIKTKID